MSNSTHPLQNAAQGMLGGTIGISNTGQIISSQQHAYNQAITSGSAIYRKDWMAPRVHIEVDRVTNGYVLDVGGERMIAKDLEELQQHFTAQIVSKLVLDEAK